jgi:hypothetical protein
MVTRIDPGGAQLGVEASRRLRETGPVEMQPGLTETEFVEIERRFGFEFPDDLRAFLASTLPIWAGAYDADPDRATIFGFPDWRNGDPELLRLQVEFPVEALLDDIERGHWPNAWGERPLRADRALGVARRRLGEVPRLVPVYAHRYLPSGRGTWGHPVLSIRGSDIIYYGADLPDYFWHEFAPAEWEEAHPYGSFEFPPATASFWKDYL